MKIMIASDSYKGSLSSLEVAQNIQKGVLEVFPDSEFEVLAMADGGEGTVEALMDSLHGTYQQIECMNPLYEKINATYGVFHDNCAIIEMASTSGLPLVKEKKIRQANTFGTGQLILDALNKGCRTIYIGIGGSATNDGGIGMAHALGVRFYDSQHQLLSPIPQNLPLIDTIDSSSLDARIQDTQIIVMCDVDNPLCGKKGASNIYGPQKGATQEDILFLDHGLQNLADVCQQTGYQNFQNVAGAGAAGGLGFGLMTFLNAKLQNGIKTILDIVHFDERIQGCQLVITGEGRIDHQSIYGKVPTGVALAAKKHHIPTIAIVGSIGENLGQIYDYIDTIESSVDHPCSLEDALKNAGDHVYQASIRMMKAIQLGKKIHF